MKRFWLVFICLFFVSSVQAQWYKRVFPVFTKKGKDLPGVSAAVERQVVQAQRQAQRAKQATLRLVLNYHPTYGPLDDSLNSAFVIEENLQGIPRRWGVSVHHYQFFRPAVEHPALKQFFPITLQAAGHKRYSDVVLFALPSQLATQVNPLKLAATLPKPGEEVSSYGYYHHGFEQLHHRRIKEVSASRLVTSYEFSDSVDRVGACGGPVLNEQDEVVGVHCGSLDYAQSSFVVPVTHIYRLLNAYYHQNQTTKPLVFNGKKIYELHINQAVAQAVALQEGKTVECITIHSTNAAIDPAHVEKLFSVKQLDKIHLYINQTDFSIGTERPSFQIEYDLKTGEITQIP